MMKTVFFFISLFGIMLGQPLHAIAGTGDDHTHGDPPESVSLSGETYFSAEVSSEKYELLLRYEPIIPGKSSEFTLFVSNYITNHPIVKADLKITAQEDPSLTFEITPVSDGIYKVKGMFPEAMPYALVVHIDGSLGADLLLIQSVHVGETLPAAHEEDSQSKKELFSGNWIVILIVLLIGIGLGMLFRKRNSPQGKATLSGLLILVCCSIPFQSSIAHGDDDHGAGGSGNVFSSIVTVPKETQFLFDIYTQKVAKGKFLESTKLFGTIIPSSSGKASVTAPQTGIVRAVYVDVGKQIKAGQTLAVIEQILDAGTQVNMMAEKNTLMAEYEAAKKEVHRLDAIRDIAAKKDIDEAAARFQKAEANLKLMNSKAGKSITLTAPISGVVGNFNLSTGTTVNPGQELFVITNLSTLYAEAQVFDKDAGKIVPEATYTLECVNDYHKTSGVKLLSYAQEINSTNQSQRVLFLVDNPDGDFKIGEFVNIRVFATTPSQQITLPNSAITEINGKPVVFLKESAEKYTPSYVQLGDNNGTHTSIVKGIEEGERAVINGSYQLKMIYLNQ